jgi:hypothetical protein
MAEIIEGTPSEPTEEHDVVDLFATTDDGKFVDPVIEDESASPASDSKQESAPATEPQTASAESDDEDESIPVKLRGKTKAEIAAIYQDLEREFGRRSNELGDLRKITDDILKAQLTPPGTNADDSEDDVSADDLLANPAAAIDRLIANNPKLKAIEEAKVAEAKAARLNEFKTAHPDAKDIMATEAFQSWLAKVPSRLQRFSAADANLDWDTADELLTTYKEVTAVAREEANQEREGALRDVKSAPASAKASGGKRKIFRKADLEKLRSTDPARYEKLQPVILQAYLEKRVI